MTSQEASSYPKIYIVRCGKGQGFNVDFFLWVLPIASQVNLILNDGRRIVENLTMLKYFVSKYLF